MSLKKQFISGTLYLALTRYLGLAIQLFIMGMLSRILTPDDFGLIAITTVFVVFFGLFADMGIGPAIIQKKDLLQEDLQSIFSFTCCIGFFLALVFILIAPFISSFYKTPALLNMCRALSVGLVFTCMNIVPYALLLKDKMFEFLMYRQLLVQIFSGIIGVTVAWYGWGVYALITYSLVSGLLTFAFDYIKRPLKPGRLYFTPLKKIGSYSLYQFMFNFMNFFSRNLDNLLIGKYFSPALLGYYEKSYKLMVLPILNLTHVISPAVQPFFAEFQHDKQRIFRLYLKIVKVLALIGLPLSVFLYFIASELILIVFGNQWKASIPVFEILSWSIGIQIILSSIGSIFQAANDTKHLFIGGFLSAIAIVFAIWAGIFIIGNIEGIAYTLFFAFLISFLLNYYILIRITLKSPMSAFFRILLYPLLIALLVFFAEFLFCKYVMINDIYLSLFLKTVVAGIVFIPMALPIIKKDRMIVFD